VIFTAEDFLHKFPLFVPAVSVLYENRVILILDSVALLKIPPSSVCCSVICMVDEIVESLITANVVVALLKGVEFLHRIRL